jgi:hypothetical protein
VREWREGVHGDLGIVCEPWLLSGRLSIVVDHGGEEGSDRNEAALRDVHRRAL